MMISRFLLTVLFLFSSPLLMAATVSGTVKDLVNGAALPSMTVEAWTAAGSLAGRTLTNAGGAYELALPSGSYRLLAYDSSGTYATRFHVDAESFDTSDVVTLTATQTITVDFGLRRAAWIVGTVRSSAGQPLAGMTVAAYNPSGTLRGMTTTDPSGAFRLVVPSGTYRIAAWDDTLLYLTRFNGDARTFESAPFLSLATSMEVRADVSLPLASSLSGVVIDEVTRAPLPGMVVQAWDGNGQLAATTLTNASGAYRLVLDSGTYRVVFSDPGRVYAPAFYGGSISFEASPVLTLATGEARGDIDGALPRGASISGRVVDARTGLALAGMVVVAWNPDGTPRTQMRTNSAGEYILVVPSGEYRVGAYDETLAHVPRFWTGSATFVGAAPINVVASDSRTGVDLSLPRSGRFTGTVRAAATGAPLAMMRIVAYDAAGTAAAETTTAADGSYVLLVASGSYLLAAWDDAGAYAVARRNATVGEGETMAAQDFALSAPATNKPRRRAVRH